MHFSNQRIDRVDKFGAVWHVHNLYNVLKRLIFDLVYKKMVKVLVVKKVYSR